MKRIDLILQRKVCRLSRSNELGFRQVCQGLSLTFPGGAGSRRDLAVASCVGG